jgi:CheY-like chemotaxis protein
VVRVSWTGRALSAEEREDAFSPRWEAPPGQRQGLGMALYIAREAAELHGGTLRAEEAAFVLELPLRSPTQEPRGRGLEGRVLVVDDDEPIARMLAEFLAESGFVADWAGGGVCALEKIQQDPPDLIVLDLRMPDLDGRELLKAIRSLGLYPRVVLLSADHEVAAAALELDTEEYVEKPFAPEGLLVAVRRALKD